MSAEPPTSTPATLGRYELVAKLATGGMGEIFLARLAGRAGFEKMVVLKRLLPELAPGPQFVQMFFEEARLAARLSHPNVCEVHELGEEAGQYYIVMQYLEGVPFSSLMRRAAGEDGADAARTHLRAAMGVLVQACEGLHHAHELTDEHGKPLGVVHRDVSPSNLFVTGDGVMKVLDFGIAKARGLTSETEKGMLKGKFAYMSPEQLAEGRLDRRSDVFCLGIVAWEAATQQRLFKRDSVALAARAVLEDPIASADTLNPAVPPALARVIARALERVPGDRPESARQLGEELKAAALAIGGVMEPAELAREVQRRFAAEIERQRALYRRSAVAAEPLPATKLERPSARTADLPPARPKAPARGPLVAAVVAFAAVGATLAWRARSERSADVATIAADAAPAVAAAPLPLPDAAPVPVPDAAPAPAPRAPPSPTPRAPRGTGFVSIDSSPYAVLYLDGKRLGETPLIRHALPAGRHRVRAVLADGRSRTFTVKVPAGGSAPPVQLSW